MHYKWWIGFKSWWWEACANDNMAVYSGYIRKVFTNYLTNKHLRLQWVWVLVLWFLISKLNAMTSSVSTFEYCDWLTIAAPSFVTYLSFSRNWNYKESQCCEKWYFVFNWEIWAVSVYKQQGSPLRWRSPWQNILEQWFQFHTISIIESMLHQHCFLDRKYGSEEDFVFWIIERERLSQSAILTLNTWPDKTCCYTVLHLSSWKSVLLHYKWLEFENSSVAQLLP